MSDIFCDIPERTVTFFVKEWSQMNLHRDVYYFFVKIIKVSRRAVFFSYNLIQ